MDKFELKEKLINCFDTIDNMVCQLMKEEVADEKTGYIRSHAYLILTEAMEKLAEKFNNIY